MIEQLEGRALFSITPAHAALNVLRADVASIGHTIDVMIAADKSAIANLQNDMSIFPTRLTTDHLALQDLSDQFRVDVSNLANDFNDAKVFLGQDITQLINYTNVYNRNPTVGIGAAVETSEQLITAQGNAMVTVVGQDSNSLQAGYVEALAILPVSHPSDAILGIRAANIANALASNVAAIQSAASTVAQTDIASFITALEPAGVISPDGVSTRRL